MKRRDLERHLHKNGAKVAARGWQAQLLGFDEERSTAVPRHREIGWQLVREICKQLGLPMPKGGR